MWVTPLSHALAFEVLDDVCAEARQDPICSHPEHLPPPSLEPVGKYPPARQFAVFRVSKRIIMASLGQFRFEPSDQWAFQPDGLWKLAELGDSPDEPFCRFCGRRRPPMHRIDYARPDTNPWCCDICRDTHLA